MLPGIIETNAKMPKIKNCPFGVEQGSAAVMSYKTKQNLQHSLFPFPDLRPKRSEGRDGIDVDKFVNLPHRCFGGVIRPPSHVRLEQLILAHGIDHGLDSGDIFI